MTCNEFESLIEGYLAGQLQDPVMESFEQHYFECSRCFSALRTEEILQKKLFKISLKKNSAQSFPSIPRWIWGMAAACLVVLISIPVFFGGEGETTLKKLARFEPPIYYRSETRNTDGSSEFRTAMEHYQKSDYHAAIRSLEQIPKDSLNSQVHFYMGISLLMTKKSKDAVEEFNKIINEMDPSYFDEAIYYIGIAYLKMGEKKRAIRQFEQLTDMFSPFQAKAQAILSQLK